MWGLGCELWAGHDRSTSMLVANRVHPHMDVQRVKTVKTAMVRQHQSPAHGICLHAGVRRRNGSSLPRGRCHRGGCLKDHAVTVHSSSRPSSAGERQTKSPWDHNTGCGPAASASFPRTTKGHNGPPQDAAPRPCSARGTPSPANPTFGLCPRHLRRSLLVVSRSNVQVGSPPRSMSRNASSSTSF